MPKQIALHALAGHASVAIGCALAVAACGVPTTSDAPPDAADAVPPADINELPTIELAPGDGLPDALPADLVWQTNDEDPPFASPEAKRGGTFRSFIQGFPANLRRVGPDSNDAFAGYLRYNQMSPVSYHPDTRRPIPALATHWAFGADGRSIYYKLNPAARWSDGMPVTAGDFVFALRFMRSKEIVAPWYNNYYTERIRDVKRYDDHTIGIQGANAKPAREMHSTYGFGPQPRHFHMRYFNDDWVKNTNWEIEPNTGPYQISDVKKGKSIELTRKEDWWANDLTYYRHRFNPTKIRLREIGDLNVAFQHFLKGELDTFGLVLPQYWHEKATGESFDAGYIAKYWYYNNLPVPSSGMFLNTADPILADANVRYGLAHAMNFDRVINTVLRGDYQRLPTFQLGFGAYDNRAIQAREFDLNKAGDYFDAAGFSTRGADGIRMRLGPEGEAGQRLSLRITYGASHHTERLVVLQEEAKKAGVELTLQLLDPTLSFKQMQEKKHQIAWMAWNSSGLAPRYWEHFHSVNAGKPQTNNLTNHANPAMDELIMAYRASADFDERVALAHRLEQMVHDAGVVIPRTQVPYARAAAWRWVKLPPWLGTRTSGSLFNSQVLSAGAFSAGGLFWIDAEEKERTLEAKADGRAFEPTTVVNTDHKAG